MSSSKSQPEKAAGRVYIVMGVSGSGKTTIGEGLARRLNCGFFDADDFHPAENVAKMASGVPLNDDDRAPWLASIHEVIGDHLARGETAVVTCSALKKRYRERLSQGLAGVVFIHLDGRFDLIWQRMAARDDHFMKAEMLQSQFEALESPTADEALIIDIDQPVEAVLEVVIARISKEIGQE